MPVMTQLACSLVEAKGTIKLKENSRIRQIYGNEEIAENYHCSFGFNLEYQFLFDNGKMKIIGTDKNGEPRVVELESHPFFIAPLFQPERSALSDEKHPLVAAYLQAARMFQSESSKTERKSVKTVAEA